MNPTLTWASYDAKLDTAQAIVNAAIAENRSMTAEESAQIEALKSEANGIKATLEQAGALQALADDGNRPTTAPIRTQAPPVTTETQPPQKDDGGFQSFGEFLIATKYGDPKGRLIQAASTADGGPGGYPIPDKFVDQILMLQTNMPSLRNYATVIPADPTRPDAGLEMPLLDQSGGMYGGVAADWVEEEGGEKPETNIKFGITSWKPHELAAWIAVTDKLLRNSTTANTVIRDMLVRAMSAKENEALLFGDGANKPTGIFDASNTALIKVPAKVAGAVWYDDLANMRMHMDAATYHNAVWFIDQKLMPLILTMTDERGAMIYLPGNANMGVKESLMGRPIQWMNEDVGLSLLDASKYFIQDGTGLHIAASPHVRFTQNQTVIKIFKYVDGKSWVQNVLTMPNGNTLSAYVKLDMPVGP